LQATYDRTGQPIMLVVQRGANTTGVTLTPRVNPPKGEGPMGIRLDATPIREDYVSYPLWQAVPVGVARTWDTATAIFTGFRRMVQGTAPQGSVGGPVEIGRVTGIACQLGILRCMEFTALLSVNLAIINLFPFPALDGGRLMFVLLEGLRRGKRVAPEKEGLVHFIGMAILLLLLVLITFNDVLRLLGLG
jgi:regulator of sigma E protease